MSKLKYPRLTDEEKRVIAPALHAVWQGIGPDVIEAMGTDRIPRGQLVEIVCDANRPFTNGHLSRALADRLSDCYFSPDTQKWLRKELNY